MMEIPSDLSKKELEFWSWLTESYIIPEQLDFEPSKKTTKSRLVTTEEIKQIIADAFGTGNSQLADNLLEIASTKQLISNEIIRKSSRLKTGEYLKLLYIKLLEDTSFSDVIIKILMPYTTKYLEKFMDKWQKQLTQSDNRIGHLFSLIESWNEMSPESRSRAVDMGLRDFEGNREIAVDYPYNLDEVKQFLPDYYLGEVDRKLSFDEGSIYRPKPKMFSDFEEKWREELDEYPLGNIFLNVSIDETNRNKLVFEPIVRLSRLLFYEEQLELFEKYGERVVLEVINLFMVLSGSEPIDYRGSLDEDAKNIIFDIDIPLPGCVVTIEDANNYDIERLEKSDFVENLNRDNRRLSGFVSSLCQRVDVDESHFFEKDYQRYRENMEKGIGELHALHYFIRSKKWDEFLKLVTRLASIDDFGTIKSINSIRNRILNYFKVENLMLDLVESSIRRRSVVSFYVSRDVWRFLPLVLKEQDWYTIADQYLSSLAEQRRQNKIIREKTC